MRQVKDAAPRGIVAACGAPLARLSVCKKIGLGYVPAVSLMFAAALASLLVLRTGASGGTAVVVLEWLLVGGIIVVGIVSVAAMRTAFSVGVRVRAVLAAAEAAAGGDLNQHVDTRPPGDEVDRLAVSFNTMTDELRERLASEQSARREAEAANRAKSQFLSNMSHEIRTPLTTMLGFSELLREAATQKAADSGEPNYDGYITHIHDSARHLLALVNDVLDLSGIEAGKTSMRLQPMELRELLRPVVVPMRQAAGKAGLRFDVDAPDGGTIVTVDAVRMRQVLHNLLSNAVKFTPAGGSVTIRARAEGDSLLIEVQDTGVGIPTDQQHRMFGLFERLHADRLDVPGSGLGLALTKRLVELHQGEIGFESRPGRGTTFHVRLPETVSPREITRNSVVELEEAIARPERRASSAPRTPLRILMVEDDRVNARLFADALAVDAHSVTVEYDGRAGYERALSQPFDVIVLDIRLPGMRGDDVCRSLRARGVEVPIIALSAAALPTEVNAGVDAGFDAYLTKPISPAFLRDAVRTVARKQAVAAS